MTTSNHQSSGGAADHERWLAALAYLFFLCFIPLWRGRDSEFVRFHARQGFLLFLSECVAFALLVVVEKTLGRIPFLGMLIFILAQMAVYLTALFLSVMGLVKALFGERWEMPFFGPYREKVPLL